MLYIISGASRSGKTVVAKELLSRKKLPYLSIDYLMMGFMNGVPEMEIHDKLWPHEIAEKMWKFLEPFMETIIYSGIDYVLEGEAILPKLIYPLYKRHSKQISICFLGYEIVDVKEKVNDIKTYASVNDWLINLGDDQIVNHVSNMIQYSQMIHQEADKFHLPYVDTSINFRESIEHCIDELITYE